MTIALDSNKVLYTGNGVTTIFPFSFRVDNATHLQVYSKDVASGALGLLVQGVDYTLVGVPGVGSVTYAPGGIPISSATQLLILRLVPVLQGLDIANQSGFYPETLEAQLDLMTMVDQQQEEQLGRTVQAGLGQAGQVLPKPAATQLLGWDAAGLVLENKINVANTLSPVDLRDQLDVAVYVTSLIALRALDTTKDILALLKLPGSETVVEWDGSDLSARTVVTTVTSTAVNSATDTITKVAHGFETGKAVVVTTAVNGLALNTIYWTIKVDADNFKLAASQGNAFVPTAVDLTGTTNFTMKRLYDPNQSTYIIKTGAALDGSAGAWVKWQSAPTGQFYEENGARVNRISDRLLVGAAARASARQQYGQGDKYSDYYQSVGRPSSYMQLAQMAVINGEDNNAAYSLLAVAHTKNLISGLNGIGLVAKGINDNTTFGNLGAFGIYVEAFRAAGAGGGATGAEIDPINFGAMVQINPFLQNIAQTIGLQMASGGDTFVSNETSAAINLRKNGSTFKSGMIFGNDAISGTDGTAGQGEAIAFATGHQMNYYYADGVINWGMGANPGANGNYAFATTGTGAVVLPKMLAGTGNQTPTSPATVTSNVSALPAPPAGTMLHVAAADGATSRILADSFGVVSSSFTGRNARGTAAARTATQSGDQLVSLSAFGYGATGYAASGRGVIQVLATENWSDTAQGTKMTFSTTLNTTIVPVVALTIDNNGAILATVPGGGVGYGTGAGGTVGQTGSKSTAVALNKMCGQITMNAAALAAATIVSFSATNTGILATDVIVVNHISGGTTGAYTINARCTSGTITFDVRNNTAGSLSEAIVIQYAVVKAVNA